MASPIPIPAGMVPAPVVPPRQWPGVLHVRQDERRAELLRVFARLQDERDDHEARCSGRALQPNVCLALWSLDERLRLAWAEITFLGGDVADLYQPRACAPGCPECATSEPHHAARCTAWDDGPCICEAPAPMFPGPEGQTWGEALGVDEGPGGRRPGRYPPPSRRGRARDAGPRRRAGLSLG